MGTFEETITIAAPREAVWDALADIGAIHEWNPGVRDSRLTSAQASGVGAERSCDLGSAGTLDERVVLWEPPERLTMRVMESTLPFAHADIAFTLRETSAGTTVTVSPDYALKYGPLGMALDAIAVRHTYRRGMQALLRGLRGHVENTDENT